MPARRRAVVANPKRTTAVCPECLHVVTIKLVTVCDQCNSKLRYNGKRFTEITETYKDPTYSFDASSSVVIPYVRPENVNSSMAVLTDRGMRSARVGKAPKYDLPKVFIQDRKINSKLTVDSSGNTVPVRHERIIPDHHQYGIYGEIKVHLSRGPHSEVELTQLMRRTRKDVHQALLVMKDLERVYDERTSQLMYQIRYDQDPSVKHHNCPQCHRSPCQCKVTHINLNRCK